MMPDSNVWQAILLAVAILVVGVPLSTWLIAAAEGELRARKAYVTVQPIIYLAAIFTGVGFVVLAENWLGVYMAVPATWFMATLFTEDKAFYGAPLIVFFTNAGNVAIVASLDLSRLDLNVLVAISLLSINALWVRTWQPRADQLDWAVLAYILTLGLDLSFPRGMRQYLMGKRP